ncbi:MAG: hypothetical protein A2504_07005 [Bdellovibrionales bacterium RIFOXYD12_FULL_39_22]|nr:MAG: hypothetical protein A2385_05220 [Bdellovibrionales bacterium RIFOXYB1_FULL_39_21]OFZ44323.1 MAG: hypothetical protein A2485_16000 [Bdellovibrionales bacterium RIFOXYC12_FULL_39_17]OFZ49178.1 MAG: hypothetical protein A2404_15940 [Bdellovibrionales bacterium RIFOXYC1_FULL_39_130]OFZ76986.1 MAG: hypothetical protein A2560_11025 [Bdellovibrionales bacterium RIFOXYD1_FULL_39_84]OFZ95199.1 MAG: hypothetical protein A2504_07005 [Bdellovibrionales bacterium RIFOXYD12_FULL_39_22]HLE09648.1 ra
MLAIELINRCNFDCFFCGARLNKIDQPRETIPNSIFYPIIDDAIHLGVSRLKLTPSTGEIFLDNEIYEKLDYIEKSKIEKVEFHTNFSLVNIDKLLRYKKLHIFISHYGCGNYETFSYMTQQNRAMFDRIEDNIAEAKRKGLHILVDPRPLSYDFNYDNTDDKTLPDTYKTKRDRIVMKNGLCGMLWLPRILSNGDFVYCTCSGKARDLPSYMILGNVFSTSLEKLYLSAKRKEMILEHKGGKYNDYCLKCNSFSKKITPTIFCLRNFSKMK